MLSNTLLPNVMGFVWVFGVIAAVGWVTRSFFATLLSALLFSILVLGSFAVQLGTDVASILEYADDPKEPLMVILTQDRKPISGFSLKAHDILVTKRLLDEARSKDHAASEKAKAELQRLFGKDLPEGYQGILPPTVTQALVDGAIATLDPKALARLDQQVQTEGWSAVAKGSFRLIRIDVGPPHRALARSATALTPFWLPTGVFTVGFKVPFVFDCIAAPDCGQRIADAMRDPTLVVSEIEGRKDVDVFLNQETGAGSGMKDLAAYVPNGAIANVASTVLAYSMAIKTAMLRDPGSLVELVEPQPIEVYPKTATSRLLDRLLALSRSRPVMEIVRGEVARQFAKKG